MKFSFEPSKPQLKVFSAVCSNLAAGWIVAMVVTRDPLVLTFNIVAAILFWQLAVKAESLLEET